MAVCMILLPRLLMPKVTLILTSFQMRMRVVPMKVILPLLPRGLLLVLACMALRLIMPGFRRLI